MPNKFSGWFLQVSNGVQIEVDTTKQAQIIDDVTNPDNPTIVTEGERISKIKINNADYSPTAEYTFAVTKWISEGFDGFVTLKNIDASRRAYIIECSTCSQNRESLKAYIKNTPVTPIIEGRIVIK